MTTTHTYNTYKSRYDNACAYQRGFSQLEINLSEYNKLATIDGLYFYYLNTVP